MPELPQTTMDSDLIQRTLEGSQDAFAELVRLHRPVLLNAALRMLRNLQDAEDLVQYVFIEAYRHLVDFRQDARLSTWLYSITLNRARNVLRQRRRRLESSLEDPAIESDGRFPKQWSDPQPSIVSELEKSAELSKVHEAIQHLMPFYRDLITDHYLKGMPLQAIAEKTKRPLNTIKVYLLRARQEMAKHMEENA